MTPVQEVHFRTLCSCQGRYDIDTCQCPRLPSGKYLVQSVLCTFAISSTIQLPVCSTRFTVHTCSGHAGDVEALLPLLLDPLKGEGIADFVALLCVARAFAHHHQ